jgi:hypothetical protein
MTRRAFFRGFAVLSVLTATGAPLPAHAGCIARLAGLFASRIPVENRLSVAELASKYGVGDHQMFEFPTLVNRVEEVIKSGQGSALEKADQMARFGMELDPLLANLSQTAQRNLRFSVARAVQTFEAFAPGEYEARPLRNIEAKPLNWIHFADYPEYVESYIEDKPPFSKVIPDDRYALDIRGIRDGAANNMWPLLLDKHDVLHVHYALGHPKAAAAYFMSARSRAPLRFAFVSALYEGVDKVQYEYETQLCKYFKKTMKMDLEQALVYAAKAPLSELGRIASLAGAEVRLNQRVLELENWTPPRDGRFTPSGYSGDLNGDLDIQVQRFENYSRDSAHAKYTNYSRKRPGRKGAWTQDDSIHY